MPADLRKRHRLDRPGAQLGIVEREDGVIELHAHMAIPAEQAGFWTKEWLQGEREVDEHVVRGEETTHDGPDEFLAHLDALEPSD